MGRSNLISVLDIGSKKISVFIGSKGVNDIFVVKAKAEIDYAGFAGGEWLDYKNLGIIINKAIKQAENLANIKIKKIYLGVPGEFITIVAKEVPGETYNKPHTVTSADLDRIYEKGNTFEQSGEYVSINTAPIFFTLDNTTRLVDPCGSTVREIKGLVSYILADKKFYNLMSKLMEKIGLKEVEFISSNWAEGMYLFDDEQRDKYVLLADVGYISSSISLFRGDGILFQRSFSLGGGHIEADLFRVLNIPYDQAVQLRKKVNLSLQPAERETYEVTVEGKSEKIAVSYVQSIVSARITDIAEVLADCIGKCEYDCPKYVPMHLTGGGITNIGGARDILQQTVGRNVEIIAPNVPDHNKPAYSSVFGLMYIAARLEDKPNGIKKIFSKLFR